MNIETALKYLGFTATNFKTKYFRTYQYNQDYLFVYLNRRSNEKMFANASGEFTGNIDDLICYYYLKNVPNKYSEGDRLKLFYENNKPIEEKEEPLIGLKTFNLFNVLLEKGKPYQENTFNNVVLLNNHAYFYIVDEEKTSNTLNVLGLVDYDLATSKVEEYAFSDLKRGVYFSNPALRSDTAIFVNSIEEMLFLNKKLSGDYLYIYIPTSNINYNQSRTIHVLLTSKGIKKRTLAFSNSISGFKLDLSFLQQFYKLDIKEKFASIKIEIPQNELANKLIQRTKDLKEAIQKSVKKFDVKNEFITIKQGVSIENKKVFVIEVFLIDNIVKCFLTLLKKYYFPNEEFTIIKSPDSVNFSDINIDEILKSEINLQAIKNYYSFV